MTTDNEKRLAALLDAALADPANFGSLFKHNHRGVAAVLADVLGEQGVTVGLDVDRLAAALKAGGIYGEPVVMNDRLATFQDAAAAIARAYAVTPQPAEEEGHGGSRA